MKTTEYRRFVSGLVSPPHIVKPALRAAMKTKRLLNTCHAIIGFKTETGELLVGMLPFMTGSQLNADMLTNAREELGDCMFYLTSLAKETRVKLPAFTKKVKTKHTIAETMLLLDGDATYLLDAYKRLYYGEPLNVDIVRVRVASALQHAYALSLQLFGVAPLTIILENHAKLTKRYPNGFNPAHAKQRLDKAGAHPDPKVTEKTAAVMA